MAVGTNHEKAIRSSVVVKETPRPYQRQNLKERFWGKVQKGKARECWPWIARANNAGYGMISMPTGLTGSKRSTMVLAHRLAYELTHGEIPRGLRVLHECDNSLCCNPKHLVAGSQKKNLEDCRDRGRMCVGEAHPGAKLTVEKVREIRSSDLSSYELAPKYRVSPRLIRKIRAGKSWKHA